MKYYDNGLASHAKAREAIECIRQASIRVVHSSYDPEKALERRQRLITSGRMGTIHIEPRMEFLNAGGKVIEVAETLEHLCGAQDSADHTAAECYTFDWS